VFLLPSAKRLNDLDCRFKHTCNDDAGIGRLVIQFFFQTRWSAFRPV